ncbi:MAG: DUF559 domain-containing protein [Thermoleophilaceae bacterium]
MARSQLLGLALSSDAVQYWISRGLLYPLWRGVYAVGRPEVERAGAWMGAALACGAGAALSHDSAAVLLGIRRREHGRIHVSVPRNAGPEHPGITVHRRTRFEVTKYHGIPVTTPICTLVDLAAAHPAPVVEAAVNEADKLDLVSPEMLRTSLDRLGRRPGVRVLRKLLDRRTFTLTDSELERRFLPIARRVGLPMPQTQALVNGYRADFFWPELDLVVETDGLRYHRTAAQQTKDAVRSQAHIASELVPLRFTHAQVRFDPKHVETTLRAVVSRLRRR